ncbi:lysostaphin resistance A-like protein [Methanosarcina sp. T3]|uniref:CPBP family intramembrane glutamic endopeptidase n=1 Tax=Methanosarcina sp. T3 TaxID=3439062 RepID=UPI003F85E969
MKKLIDSHKKKKESNSQIINSSLILTLLAIFPSIVRPKGMILEKVESKDFRLYIAIPILCMALAELLFFSGRIAVAICVHIGILIALSLSNIFIIDPKIHKIYMPLMLLPLLRLINLSTPVFFETTLYSFIFTYIPLAVSVAVIIAYQSYSLEEIGVTTKNLPTYMFLSVPLGFFLGLGEYLIIRPEYLIPDLTFGNLFKLTFLMVFLVGLVEELLFRSILQTRFEKVLGVREALIITSLLFGLMHSGYGTFYEIFYTVFAGFVIGALFYKTKSLPFITVLHGFANVFLFGILPHHLIG